MQLSLSAGGSPDVTKQALRDQINNQLGTAPNPTKANVAAAILEHIDTEIGTDGKTVSVSGSLWISITKTDPVPAGVGG